MQPLDFITLIRNTFGGRYPNESLGCFKFGYILTAVFPEGELYYNSNHVVVKIKDCFYDIDGVYTKDDLNSYLHHTAFGDDAFYALKHFID